MLKLTLVAICKGKAKRGPNHAVLYKEVEWPVVPRIGETIEYSNRFGLAVVDDVWHFFSSAEEGCVIHVKFKIRREEVSDLREDGWGE